MGPEWEWRARGGACLVSAWGCWCWGALGCWCLFLLSQDDLGENSVCLCRRPLFARTESLICFYYCFMTRAMVD